MAAGEYNYSEEGGNMTWTYGGFQTLLEYADITRGILKISKSGSTYTITFNGKDSTDKNININYKGAIIKN